VQGRARAEDTEDTEDTEDFGRLAVERAGLAPKRSLGSPESNVAWASSLCSFAPSSDDFPPVHKLCIKPRHVSYYIDKDHDQDQNDRGEAIDQTLKSPPCPPCENQFPTLPAGNGADDQERFRADGDGVG
jgi:hypothetical protein